ncbi:MAG TPA: helix-turn-helix transcriptional regulator, partial [Agriterribacter sp.]|nr:helix-turn-helix transcriptional regulator [Agriterribacter sp.]
AISVTPVDENFIRQAVEEVEKHMADAGFSVEDLSKALFMSRVALYKKLLSLTGKAPLDFIRAIRMKRAAQLLGKTQMTVSEVAYEVGFSNPKYFTRFFKKEFNMLPSEYITVHRNKREKKIN